MSKVFALLFISSLALGCSGGDDDDFKTVVCSAGETQACVCDDGKDGAQACAKDGKSWGACTCGQVDAPGADCSTDDDCSSKGAPYCVNGACAPPTIAAGGDPCPHGTECVEGFSCYRENCIKL